MKSWFKIHIGISALALLAVTFIMTEPTPDAHWTTTLLTVIGVETLGIGGLWLIATGINDKIKGGD